MTGAIGWLRALAGRLTGKAAKPSPPEAAPDMATPLPPPLQQIEELLRLVENEEPAAHRARFGSRRKGQGRR